MLSVRTACITLYGGNSAVIEKGQLMSFAEICAFLLVLLAFGTFVLKVIEARRDK